MSRDEILHLEQLVAHRELQLLRARGRAYVAQRQRKLDEAKQLLARVRAGTGIARECAAGCGRTFITTGPRDQRCPECAREHLIKSVRIIEWMDGPFVPGTMLVERVEGLTDTEDRVRLFVANECVGEGRLYKHGRFDVTLVRVREYAPPEKLVRLTKRADGWLKTDSLHITHPDAAVIIRRRGAWWVDTEDAWHDG